LKQSINSLLSGEKLAKSTYDKGFFRYHKSFFYFVMGLMQMFDINTFLVEICIKMWYNGTENVREVTVR